MNRKLLFFFLAVILTCALTACSQGNENVLPKVNLDFFRKAYKVD